MDCWATTQWILGLCALGYGIFLVVCNWVKLCDVLLTRRGASFTPFLGGCLVFVGLLLVPVDGLHEWLWVPLVADWGCIPMCGCIAVSALVKRWGGKAEESPD